MHVLTTNDEKVTKRLRFFILISIFLSLGLIISIILAMNLIKNNALESAEEQELPLIYNVDSWVGEIESRLKLDEDYVLGNAISDFEEKISSSEGREKYFLSEQYASFILRQTGDIGYAIRIMDGIGDLISDDLRLSYYLAYRNLYASIQDNEKVKYYNNLLNKLSESEYEENE